MTPGRMRTPTELSALFVTIVPALVSLLLLLMVTAVLPAVVSVIDPVDVIATSEGEPLLAVLVETGAVVAVEIDTWAKAGRLNTSGAAAPSSRRTLKVMRAVNSCTDSTLPGLTPRDDRTAGVPLRDPPA